ncbi:MAG TPA: DUF456 domain-containing protein [Nitratidesulfovibrio sp.]|nr:DUF456 domain-containing protein [Nitratidesulfovibrio sp.]
MDYILAALCIIVLFGMIGLNVFGLPGNWLAVGVLALWKLLAPAAPGMDTWFFVTLIGAAAVGEVLEFGVQMLGGKRYGSTGRGNLGGILGAIAGAILGAPFLFGLGALPGALAGAWFGCYLAELSHGRPRDAARQAAWGAFVGKFLGLSLKFAAGAVVAVMGAGQVWPA